MSRKFDILLELRIIINDYSSVMCSSLFLFSLVASSRLSLYILIFSIAFVVALFAAFHPSSHLTEGSRIQMLATAMQNEMVSWLYVLRFALMMKQFPQGHLSPSNLSLFYMFEFVLFSLLIYIVSMAIRVASVNLFDQLPFNH